MKTRVRKIVGQLNSIERMLEDERDCAEILTQLVSARKAIKSLSEALVSRHLYICMDGVQQYDGRKKLREFLLVLERYVE